MAGRANPRAGAQPRQGNFTGRMAQQLQEEHADEIRARGGEMSMLNGAPTPADELIDYDETTGKDEETRPEFETLVRDPASGDAIVEAMPMVSRRRMREALETVEGDDLQRKVEVVPNDDYEDVTIGYDNTFNFERGRRYRVPLWIAQHLERQEMLV